MKALFRKIGGKVIRALFRIFYWIFTLLHSLITDFALRLSITEYLIAPVVIKKFRYGDIEIKAQIESYTNYSRIKDYEKYPIENIRNYLTKQKDISDRLVYYEIGANVGYSFLVIAKMLAEGGKAFAFEIEPTNFKTLSNNILLNKLNNAIPVPLGIADSFKIGKLYFNRYHDTASSVPSSGIGMHSVKFDPNLHKELCFCNVMLMPLDSLIELFSMPFPTHIFIDVYGAEDSVVTGMKNTLKNPRMSVVMVDIDKDIYKSKAHAIIVASGFKMFDYFIEKGDGIVPTGYRCTYIKNNG